jgi:hypothetical protein
MKRHSIALFLSTVAIAGGVAACSKQSDGDEAADDRETPELSQPNKPTDGSNGGGEGGEGGEG